MVLRGTNVFAKVKLAAAKQAMENILEEEDDLALLPSKGDVEAGVFERFYRLGWDGLLITYLGDSPSRKQ
jgi:hypothetical protein